MTRQLLLTPGPTEVPQAALDVMAEPIFHHRTPRYQELFKQVSEDLKIVFCTSHPVYTFTGSGTCAMEAAVVNFVSPGDKVIIIEAGKFGERWTELTKRFGMNVIVLKAPYGDVVTSETVRKALQENPDTKAVYGTLCETSTAVLFDIEKISKIVNETPAIFVVDAISGLGADRLEMDKWKVNVVVSGSQKGFMAPPGLSFLAADEKAKKMIAESKSLRYYVDLAKYEKALKDADTPFTPAISVVLAMRECLAIIKKQGMEQIWKHTADLAAFTRNEMKALGLEFFSSHWSNTLTAVKVPQGINGKKLVNILRDQKGVTLAGGQGEMAGQIFRIAHFGVVTEEYIKIAAGLIKETIEELRLTPSTKA